MIMADNYLENKFEQLRERREKEQKAKRLAWRKRMDAYRKKLEESGEKKVNYICSKQKKVVHLQAENS